MPALNVSAPSLPVTPQVQSNTPDAANSNTSSSEATSFANVLQAKQGQSKPADTAKEAPATQNQSSATPTTAVATDTAAKNTTDAASTTAATAAAAIAPDTSATDATSAILALLTAANAPATGLPAQVAVSAETTATITPGSSKKNKPEAALQAAPDPLAAALAGSQAALAMQTQQSNQHTNPQNSEAATEDDYAAAGNSSLPTPALAANVAVSADATAAAAAKAAEADATNNNPVQTTTSGFEAMLAASQAEQAAHRTAANVASNVETSRLQVNNPLGSREWNQEVGDKLTWMAGRQESRAELVLNPPQLGRIEISLKISGSEANAVFTSANPQVREALENALPRLREVLADAGISLGQTHVGTNSSNQSSGNPAQDGQSAHRQQNSSASASLSGVVSDSRSPAVWAQQGLGLVDTFA